MYSLSTTSSDPGKATRLPDDRALEDLEHRWKRLSRIYDLTLEARLDALASKQGSALKGILAGCLRKLEWQFLPHYWGTPPRWRMLFRQLVGRRTLPDFCVVGAPKCGTSDVAVRLMLHPNVMTPLIKECWAADAKVWRTFYPTERERNRHAARLGLALAPFFGACLQSPELADELSRVRDHMRVVLLLRNPVHRVFSQWKWELLLCGNSSRFRSLFANFASYVDRALEVFPDYPMHTMCGFQPIQSSIYWRAVHHWTERFGAANVAVFDVSEYFADRDGCMRKIHAFLGLPHVEFREVGGRVNINPLVVPPADRPSLDRLGTFFAPYNRRLFDVIGKEFSW